MLISKNISRGKFNKHNHQIEISYSTQKTGPEPENPPTKLFPLNSVNQFQIILSFSIQIFQISQHLAFIISKMQIFANPLRRVEEERIQINIKEGYKTIRTQSII